MPVPLRATSDQEAFDQIARHLRTQQGQSMTNGACRYRDYRGRKCAIGCLIDDNDYDGPVMDDPDMPGGVGLAYLISEAVIEPGELSLPLLYTLQELHDNSTNWHNGQFIADRMQDASVTLESVADDYDLTYQEPE